MTNILNNQKSSGILIYLDFRFDHTIETVSLELISQAQILSHKLNEKVYGIVITDNFSLIEKTLSELPLDKIFIYKNSFPFNSEIDAQSLLDCILNINPSIVLIGSTDKGKIIAPNIAIKLKCIITCGISGSVQFMAGMKNCKNIIAINNDINARIFDFAHYPIYGDMYEIVPKLIKEWC